MAKIDPLDREILDYLTSDARASYREIARALHVSVGTIKNRVEKLKKNKVLLGFAPIINHDALGYGLSTIIAITAERGEVQKIIKKLEKDPKVRSIYLVTGNVDIFFRARFQNTTELRDFLTKELTMPGIKASVTYIILERKTKKGFIT